MNRLKTIVILTISILLFACGGGSGGGATPVADSQQGYFIDSPVSGLGYRSEPSGISGTTSTDGIFEYKDGDTTTFHIGKVILGSAASNSVITPMDLVGTDDINNKAVINIARLLQTLDSDNNPDTGIDISAPTTQAAENLSYEEALIDFNSDDFADSAQNIIDSIGMDSHALVLSGPAQSHLSNSIDDPDNDGVINALDDDRDGDGVDNAQDAFPLDATEDTDTDKDGIGDNSDNCPLASNADQTDTNSDGVGDVCVTHGNTDGVTNDNDPNPAITTMYIQEQGENPDGSTNAPITFAQVFKQGDIPAGQSIKATLANDVELPIQVNKKATYDDGSLKHAIISAFVPELAQGENARIYLNTTEEAADNTQLSLAGLFATNYDTAVTLDIDGTEYSASAADLLATQEEKKWIEGQIVTEWMVSAPFKDPFNNEHPHLQARFNIRAYKGFESVRTSVVVENAWAFEPDPQNFTYDLIITVGGETVLQSADQIHYHHARFRRTYWWGKESNISINPKLSYLKEIKVIPNYAEDTVITDSYLDDQLSNYLSKSEIMNVGTIKPDMPGTGGRQDYGILPGWAVTYLITGDERIKKVMMGNANQAGTFSMHFRYKESDQPLTIDQFPNIGFAGGASGAFPTCLGCFKHSTKGIIDGVGTGNLISQPDSSHQPSLNYLPYLLTGDYYHLEEQIFWAAFNLFKSNPYYRDYENGLVRNDQTRGQAWQLRSFAQSAFIMPDDHPMKNRPGKEGYGYFQEKLDNNRNWYQAAYVDRELTGEIYVYENDLGWFGYVAYQSYDVDYDGIKEYTFGMVSPWMNDFVTAAIGHAMDLGNDNWNSVMQWHGKYAVGRLYGTDYCSIFPAIYTGAAGDHREGPFYDWEEYYKNSISLEFHKKEYWYDITRYECGSQKMMDWLTDKTGYGFVYQEGDLYDKYQSGAADYMSRMQGAIAYAAEYGVANADEAWSVYWDRRTPTNYINDPKYSIVPRNMNLDVDNDGVENKNDNCRFIANADQLDSDGDGWGDVCDAFPSDNTEHSDSDGDGVGTNADNCEVTANADQTDSDDDGWGDACDID